MKIVLTNEDLEELIKKAFSGVKNIKFNYKQITATLEVDRAQFTTIPIKTGVIVNKVNELTVKEPKVKKDVTPEQLKVLKQADILNKAQNERNERNRMARPGEDRPLPIVG